MKGKCSVPMWTMGSPAGSCGEPAYGEQTKEYLSEDNFPKWNLKYRSPVYAPRLACPMHGGPKLKDIAHQKDPCKHCGTPHDEVNKGACPPLAEELFSGTRAALDALCDIDA